MSTQPVSDNKTKKSPVWLSGTAEERALYKHLQNKLPYQFEHVFPDRLAPKTVVIIPSLSLDSEILAKVDGSVYYEERLLCLLLLLRMPRTDVVYLTSMPIDPVIVDYYLHLLPGVTGYHARRRLHLLSCYDGSPQPLTDKILQRPRVIQRIKEHIPDGNITHMACFNVTNSERQLALELGIPIFGCDPDLYFWGTKSGAREVFKEAGLLVPPGRENLKNEDDIAKALADLKLEHPLMKKAVVKINDGFSGDGNAVFSYEHVPENGGAEKWIKKHLRRELKLVANDLDYDTFIEKFMQMEGIVEMFIDGKHKASPSAQCRINPLGEIEVQSTHDQLLGGESGQVFLGATFPAAPEYSIELGRQSLRVGDVLKKKGVLGRFGIDFLSVKEGSKWKNYAIEINLRKGGTTHPYIMLQFLTNGNYNPDTGTYHTAGIESRYYIASDNLRFDEIKGLTPHDLIDIAITNELHYDGSKEEGVMFHLIGALSQFGKLGVICIGSSPERARMFYDKTCELLRANGRPSK